MYIGDAKRCPYNFLVFRYLKILSFVLGAGKIKRMARPTKLTPEVQENICNWLKLGYYQEDAAIMAGISPSTYYEWMKKGDEEGKQLESGKELPAPDSEISLIAPVDEALEGEVILPFLEFSEAVKKARAEAEGAHIRNIRKAADNGVWQASAWFLERSFPRKWGKRSQLEIAAGDSDEPIQFEINYGD